MDAERLIRNTITNCSLKATLQEPIRDPARFPWHEVKKVQYYWLEVNAMTKPMQVWEDQAKFENRRDAGDKHQ